jgi:hypothetical protein
MDNDDVCPECGGVEIRLVYRRLDDAVSEWQGSCWDCRHQWTVGPKPEAVGDGPGL